MTEDVKTKQLEVTTDEDGKTRIVFRKAALKGKVIKEDVMNALMIAARMQVEKYIEKLSRGAPLSVEEIRAMKDIGEIMKIDIPQSNQQVTNNTLVLSNQEPKQLESVKASLYAALTNTLGNTNETKE